MPWLARQGRLYVMSGNKGTPILNWTRDPAKAHRFSTKEAAEHIRVGVVAEPCSDEDDADQDPCDHDGCGSDGCTLGDA